MANKAPVPQPGILDISPYVPGESSVPGGVKPIKLSSNETPLGPSPKADRRLQGARPTQLAALSGRRRHRAAQGHRRAATGSTPTASSAAAAPTS